MIESIKNSLPLDNIKQVTPVSGGDVNEAYKVETADGKYFLLIQKNRNADFYEGEIAGLKAFEEAGVTAPKVINYGEIEGNAYLLLDYLEEGVSGSQRELGQLVAKLHRYHQPEGKFGFDSPYEGSDITFDNSWTETWSELFIHQRLDHLEEEIIKNNLWTEDDVELYHQVREKIVHTLENHESEPSLLHGDLWAGNYMFLKDGKPAIFDPSPLFGDREFDLGATRVFGGFDQDFYEAYHNAYPLEEGADDRILFYELYLLLVHLVKFGSMYASSVRRTMQEIISEY